MSCRLSRQALRGEKQRLARERDQKLDAAIRRIQRERVEFDDASKAEAEEEARRLEEVRRWWSCGGEVSSFHYVEVCAIVVLALPRRCTVFLTGKEGLALTRGF